MVRCTFIYREQQSRLSILRPLDSTDEGTSIHQNVLNLHQWTWLNVAKDLNLQQLHYHYARSFIWV